MQPKNSSVETARVGSSVSFTCNASGIPLPTIRWMRQNALGSTEIASNNVKYQVVSSSGSSQLIIKDISVDDQSYYICNASSYEFHLDRAFLGVVCKFFLHWFKLKLNIDILHVKIQSSLNLCLFLIVVKHSQKNSYIILNFTSE